MNTLLKITSLTAILGSALIGCTTAKLEARLEANPQCKDVYNSKTGALMPCPGTDKSFYVAAGLEAPRQAKPVSSTNTVTSNPASALSQGLTQTNTSSLSPSPTQISTVTQSSVAPATSPAQSDCKPTIHKKTGGMLPCPPLD